MRNKSSKTGRFHKMPAYFSALLHTISFSICASVCLPMTVQADEPLMSRPGSGGHYEYISLSPTARRAFPQKTTAAVTPVNPPARRSDPAAAAGSTRPLVKYVEKQVLDNRYQVYADPSKEIIWFSWEEALAETTRVEIYDILGDRLDTLYQYAPYHCVGWNIEDRVLGIIYCRVVFIRSDGEEIPLAVKKIAIFH
ncbi:hypothetical protein JW933_05285 [candidate division FCPU426 bacterium]|nr:hypothetical protein [candidate division FCPU426 bacterium]